VLQFCFKSNAGYSLMPYYSPATRSLFVRLPDKFYVTNLNVVVPSDCSRKYVVGYSYFAAASGNLMSASTSISAHESSDFDSLASDA